MPKWTRRFYVEVAATVRGMPAESDRVSPGQAMTLRENQAAEWARKFAADNPAFLPARFLEACGIARVGLVAAAAAGQMPVPGARAPHAGLPGAAGIGHDDDVGDRDHLPEDEGEMPVGMRM